MASLLYQRSTNTWHRTACTIRQPHGVLGPTFERSLRQTLLITDGDLVASLTGSPIALALVALGILLLASGLFGINRRLPAED